MVLELDFGDSLFSSTFTCKRFLSFFLSVFLSVCLSFFLSVLLSFFLPLFSICCCFCCCCCHNHFYRRERQLIIIKKTKTENCFISSFLKIFLLTFFLFALPLSYFLGHYSVLFYVILSPCLLPLLSLRFFTSGCFSCSMYVVVLY